MQRVLHPKQPLVLDPADRGVRGQPQRAMRKNIANMVRPARTRRIVASPVARRTQADADSRCASNGPDDPDERNRAVPPFGTGKHGTKIGDVYRVASGIFTVGDTQGGSPHIILATLEERLVGEKVSMTCRIRGGGSHK